MVKNAIQQAAALASKEDDAPRAAMQQYIRQMQGEIRKALPSVMTPERFRPVR